ncbi:MAG: DNA-binding response regulator [Armatimonadetes bacterium CG_4_10_14_3_um_filter_66_18]|nr:response regulator transcription factor [Armatimonadota bacterium]OIP04425.1 MAG: hypothetical protein AUJ96_12860 [Armatimonadetes bacterium CG2_30_66_41]PIU90046.1 MAG: DNA-binding response regulator [Armatimonadetes bacterium CG06_land_8_20_14_3_00_66_21]PIW17685.1 MAG: DNA-binding response regulator [Armatimonadetes bacterium CG17_big_fil_post_rev_8_21_14_2_50_66_6]PIX39289.1 MAG: DNA-binding response regulator [Armatimonadetes bacterium CG_4_8_14_3_um_filter_66_20]PIY54161.1 MAG: DNA-b
MNPIRILLVDDHLLLRSGLHMMLDQEPDLSVVGETGNGCEAVDLVKRLRPDVVLMDIAIPGISGVEATQRIGAVSKTTRVIAVTMHEDPRYVRQMLEAGAVGYVSKSAADSELLDAIRAVHRGRVFVHPSVAGTVVAGYLGRSPAEAKLPADPLTDRERQVVKLLALGHTSQEVADRLFISIKTVESHKGRIFEKLSLRSRADLVRYALKQGMLKELDEG